MRRDALIPFVSPITLIVLGVLVLRALPTGGGEDVPGENLYREVMSLVEHNYVVDPDEEELAFAAAQGLLQSLDRHSRVYTPEEFSQQESRSQGHYAGVGVLIGILGGEVAALEVNPHGPAAQAGLKDGDRLLVIDGEPVAAPGPDRSLSSALTALRGEPGSEVVIEVRAADDSPVRRLRIRRGRVPSINAYGYVLDAEAKIGYVCLESFRDNTPAQVDEAFQRMGHEMDGGLVLDLRGNRGGSLNAARSIADRFLGDGLIVATIGRRRTQNYNSHRTDSDLDVPLVVLVDHRSASASEVVAGALQDRGRAVLVGARTYGKGVVQEIARLRSREGAGLKITTRHYFTPSGRSIERQVALPNGAKRLGGLAPDIVVRATSRERQTNLTLRQRGRYAPAIREQLDREDRIPDDYRDRALEVAKALLRGDPAPDRELAHP